MVRVVADVVDSYSSLVDTVRSVDAENGGSMVVVVASRQHLAAEKMLPALMAAVEVAADRRIASGHRMGWDADAVEPGSLAVAVVVVLADMAKVYVSSVVVVDDALLLLVSVASVHSLSSILLSAYYIPHSTPERHSVASSSLHSSFEVVTHIDAIEVG